MSVTEIFDSMEYGPAPEGAQPAHEWLDAHGRKFGLFIGGEFVDPKSDRYFETLNPATGKPIAQIAQAESEDIDLAVQAAREAQKGWAALTGHQRARYLYGIARQIQKHSRLFAVLETLDNGKPIRETRDIDIPLVARHFYHHAGWAQLRDEELPGYDPVGVCGQIIPWNFPLLMLSWKIAPALAMGNTVILKPAEYTPLTAILFAEICDRSGLPKGVVNIVTGDGETGRLIVEHPDVDKIAFTGSTEVGRLIRESTAGSGKKISLELGGKSPFVVFEDSDQDSAIEGLVDAIWFNQGQVCCAGSRLLVQESIATRFHEKLKRRMESLRVGDPLDKAIDIGAIVAPVQLQRIGELVDKGVEEGAELFQPEWACPKEGWFYPPTLLTGVTPASTVAQVEIFGPVLVSMTFRTPAEAVALANNTPYGLAASVWTENVSLAHDIAAQIKAGTVWVNCTNQFDAASGFGGYRESGYGREGGKEGLYEYVEHRKLTPPTVGAPPPAPHASLDQTHKLYVGGKQVRPDGGYSFTVDGQEFALANRKDVRNAVEAAIPAQAAWAKQTAHLRAQVLYYLAENLETAKDQFPVTETELKLCVETLFAFAAVADKYDGQVHGTPFKGLTYTLNEPLGVIGVVMPPALSLLPFTKALGACLAMGNAAVIVPSRENPLPACLLYRVIEASDVPAGVLNILTGEPEELAPVLADHEAVDGIWCFRPGPLFADVERRSTGNLKRVWATELPASNQEWLRHAVQVKNVWVPMGE